MNTNSNADRVPAAEIEARTRRREIVNPGSGAPLFGLALSGGGIRSATFCLGLMRALAGNHALSRFDYLSTVSGGGYAGTAFGRLFSQRCQARQVEEGLANQDSLVIWWLRHNGRYLIPSGMRDLLTALAGVIRGFAATQFEIATLALLMASLILVPHVSLVGLAPDVPVLQAVGNPWWLLLPVLVWGSSVTIFAYWFCRDSNHVEIGDVLWILICVGLLAALVSQPQFQSSWVLLLLAALLSSVVAGFVLRSIRMSFGISAEADRVRSTVWLGYASALIALFTLVGCIDFLSWVTAAQLTDSRMRPIHLAGGAGTLTALLAAARTVLPQALEKSSALRKRLPLDRIANIVGLVLVAATVFAWLVVLQVWVFRADSWMIGVMGSAPTPSVLHWTAATILLGAYVILSGRNLDQLNRSSQNPFYRSRLARTYVATGNSPLADQPVKTPRFEDSLLEDADDGASERVQKVTDLVPGDDVILAAYQPYLNGGPIHLINCCINQTIDDRTGNFNADRKGVALAVSALGVEVGTRFPEENKDFTGTSLAQWVSISGAAVSSGMGSMTAPGLAAMIFMTGFRLGYWIPSHGMANAGSWIAHQFRKPVALLREFFARYPGLRGSMWYLSDGGHFDNTGVYALLKREPRLILLADCGADPNYLFADIENLVRKARIDYGASIDFVPPAGLPDTALANRVRPLFGTPDSVTSEPGADYLLLARITYRNGAIGALLVVKPRRVTALDLDVAGYSDRDPGFPQQSTADQFFDEAQWESYCELGKQLGAVLTRQLLEQLPDWVDDAPAIGFKSLASDAEDDAPPASEAVRSPETRRQRFAGTIGQSIGIGAVASLFLAGWQSWDEHNSQMIQRQSEFASQYATVLGRIDQLKQSGGYSDALRSQIEPILVSARQIENPPSVRDTLESLTDSVKALCASPATAADQQTACADYLAELSGNANPRQQSLWSQYAYWNAQYWALDNRNSGGTGIVGSLQALIGSPLGRLVRPTAPQSAPTATVAMAGSPSGGNICSSSGPSKRVVYIQIYSENRRSLATDLAETLGAAGIAVPGIENVTTAALSQNQPAPYRWRSPALLFTPDDTDCANALLQQLSNSSRQFSDMNPMIKPLPASLHGTAGTMELWLP